MKVNKKLSEAVCNLVAIVGGQKGGLGKTTISLNIATFLTDAKKVFQIDNNNFQVDIVNSKKVKGITVKTDKKAMEEALDEADFASYNEPVVIDAGGGDDTTKVFNGAQAIGLKAEYYLPLTPDPDTLAVLQQTKELIIDGSPINLIFSNFRNLVEDFWFIFGSEEYGIEPNLEILKQFDNIYQVPNSPLFAIAKAYQTTVWDLALIHTHYELQEEKQKWRELGKEQYHKKMQMHRLSVDCHNLLENVKNSKNSIEV